ncbi:putative u3 small nucleolar ribonucleoprotein mpp10 [Venturia nashicola]|uniref:U3 small nucleolar ribonucleoprotein protein MPP10 n=1 Tax=Venturia nashicola TaxID=86259 RepID=A0A4Z1NW82_9PEZI|nr:putative u3 small nucleolar ribonucleoprotein mpp10 [Venturia nashicola]
MAATITPNSLLTTLQSSPQAFLQPSLSLQSAALQLAKQYLDPIATSISDVQNLRLKESRKKRKRGQDDDEEEVKRPLNVKKVHLEGFKVEQVWQQVRRVVEAAKNEVESVLPTLEGDEFGFGESGEEGSEDESDEGSVDVEEEYHSEDEQSIDGGEASGEDVVEDLNDVETDEDGEDEEEEGSEDIMAGFDDVEDDFDEGNQPAEEFVTDKFGLNDGFFSIDDFNRQSDFLENVDARGDPDDGAASDEEEIDWSADPMTWAAPAAGSSKKKPSADEGEDSDDEGGPTFGNVDLNAPEGDSDDDEEYFDMDVDMDNMDDQSNANNIMYGDFFAPPPKKGVQRAGKRGRPMAHNFPAKDPSAIEAEPEEDIERTMAAVHRELFSDDEDDELSDAEGEEVDHGDPKSRRSAHQKRQAAVLAEIRKLEAQSVAKRTWTMSGEARAADRPQNSLLEEDLEFERGGKPTPVITQEISEEIEQLIKRRILASEFDEIRRRRPDEILNTARRGRVDMEVQDTKSKQGLAEIYEEEHLRKNDPSFVEVRDEKLKAEHRDIENAWKEISSKLDSLSSLHYRPKPLDLNVQIRTDAPVVSMEDARPSGIGSGDVGGTTGQLAPQEVYKPGEEKEDDEVVTRGGQIVKRDELTREQKLRRRRREKERARKAGEHGNAKVTGGASEKGDKGKGKTESKRTKERKDVMSDLKKGGVLVIGRKGELKDVEGNKVETGGKRAKTAGGYKL